MGLLLLTPACTHYTIPPAPSKVYVGQVVDSTNHAVAGLTVRAVGADLGTVTDAAGRFFASSCRRGPTSS